MDQEFTNEVLEDLQNEVLVRGPELVAELLGIPVSIVETLCPTQSARYREAFRD